MCILFVNHAMLKVARTNECNYNWTKCYHGIQVSVWIKWQYGRIFTHPTFKRITQTKTLYNCIVIVRLYHYAIWPCVHFLLKCWHKNVNAMNNARWMKKEIIHIRDYAGQSVAINFNILNKCCDLINPDYINRCYNEVILRKQKTKIELFLECTNEFPRIVYCISICSNLLALIRKIQLFIRLHMKIVIQYYQFRGSIKKSNALSRFECVLFQ